ncbi:MAG: serine protease [Oscillospiraceae bacterium]|nr:serine protease [Oscillospiraceae bacterium]
MRKTQEEVKEELRRRRDRYVAHRRARRQRLLGGGAALAICLVVVLLVGRIPPPSPELIGSGVSQSGQGPMSAPSVDESNGTSAEETSPQPSLPPDVSSDETSIDGDTAVSTQPGDTSEPSDTNSSEPQPTDPPEGDPPVPDAPVVYPVGFDLMANIHAMNVRERGADDKFIRSHMQFAVALLQQTLQEEGEKGALVSPLSAQLALAMTANGTNGATLAQMEAVLGGGISLSRLNEYLRSYTASLPSSEGAKLTLANSIWFPEGEDHPREDFLQANADYYGAEAYQAPHSEIYDLINDWVNTRTDGKIDKLVDEGAGEFSMALINTILFDGKWKDKYTDRSVWEGTFTAYNGEKRYVPMLSSTEWSFLQDGDGTTGFLKPYEDERYAFAALLPAEGVDILDYINSLTADRLLHILQDRHVAEVYVRMPKFTFAGDYKLNKALKAMGMPYAFDEQAADFSRTFNGGGVYLDLFKQKTVIEVSEFGTVAAGVSGGEMAPSTSEPDEIVYLDRPFVYMILDTETNLPLFLGVLTDISDLS